MRIAVQCSCGKVLQVDTRFAGTTRKCVFCGKDYRVPDMDNAALSGTILDGEHNEVVAKMQFRSDTRPQWNSRYWWMMVALIPLVIFAFNKDDSTNFRQKLNEAREQLSESEKKKYDGIMKGGDSERGLSKTMIRRVMRLLPGHKLPDALLAYDSWGHWFLAFISAGVFLTLAVTLFPSRTTETPNLLYVSLFTGTAGIMMLLAVQAVAFSGSIGGYGVFLFIFLIIKLIGLSYMAALDPEYGFLVSLLGFTCGVGLCEELCKVLPVFWHFRRKSQLDWRGACAWGLASGIGFGVSEGITYSSDFYNGLLSADIYLVRFVSCVALHAVWAASAGINLWKHQDRVEPDKSNWLVFLNLIGIVIVPMLLHGLYDTLLKKDYQIGAMVSALLSFAWMAWTIEDAKKHELHLDAQPA